MTGLKQIQRSYWSNSWYIMRIKMFKYVPNMPHGAIKGNSLSFNVMYQKNIMYHLIHKYRFKFTVASCQVANKCFDLAINFWLLSRHSLVNFLGGFLRLFVENSVFRKPLTRISEFYTIHWQKSLVFFNDPLTKITFLPWPFDKITFFVILW